MMKTVFYMCACLCLMGTQAFGQNRVEESLITLKALRADTLALPAFCGCRQYYVYAGCTISGVYACPAVDLGNQKTIFAGKFMYRLYNNRYASPVTYFATYMLGENRSLSAARENARVQPFYGQNIPDAFITPPSLDDFYQPTFY